MEILFYTHEEGIYCIACKEKRFKPESSVYPCHDTSDVEWETGETYQGYAERFIACINCGKYIDQEIYT